jgi:hypothetical protein
MAQVWRNVSGDVAVVAISFAVWALLCVVAWKYGGMKPPKN